MHLSNESLLVIIIVGIVAGWLAGRVMEGGGFGLIGDLLVGLIGAFIGDWLMPRLGIHLGTGIIALIINAFIGAVVLLLAGQRAGPLHEGRRQHGHRAVPEQGRSGGLRGRRAAGRLPATASHSAAVRRRLVHLSDAGGRLAHPAPAPR